MKFIALLLSLAAVPAAAQDTIHFTTEDYPPYNFREGNEIKGAGYDMVMKIMEITSLPHTIEMMPWARAIALAEATPMHCVFTAAHIPERENRFQWVEPIAVGRNFMIGRKGGDIAVKTIEESVGLVVGTQRDDYTQTLLENAGFTKIDLATDLKLTLKKLETGRIDLMPIDEQHFIALEKEGEPIEVKYVFTEQTFSIACNNDFPKDTLARMQAALDQIIADGTQAKILETYGLAGANLPDLTTKP